MSAIFTMKVSTSKGRFKSEETGTFLPLQDKYSTRAIITHGLYFFYPIFHCGLYCREVTVTDSLCTK